MVGYCKRLHVDCDLDTGREGRKGREICVVPTLPAQVLVLCEAGRIWGDDDGWVGGGRFAVECSAVGMVQLLYCCWLGWSRGGRELLDYRSQAAYNRRNERIGM